MNRLLLQLLLSSMTTTTTQNPLMANLNRILNPNAIGQVQQQPATAVTQVVTTTAISTVTQLFSTVLSVNFFLDTLGINAYVDPFLKKSIAGYLPEPTYPDDGLL